MRHLTKIDGERQAMVSLVEKWANINSHTTNQEGVEKLLNDVKKEFEVLAPDEMKRVQLGNSVGLFLQKRASAPFQIYFGGHLDTVFPLHHPFQKAFVRDEKTLCGPGVCDMKGGLVLLLKALQVFEELECSSSIGWEIFLNSDEEIGSPDSTPFIEECAKRCHLACLFEPTLEDGALVSKRKGSSNYHVKSIGKKAHTGRNPKEGKNAIYPLAHFMSKLEGLNDLLHGTLVNVGVVKGGEANNIIPDSAECHLNVRADELKTMQHIEKTLLTLSDTYHLQLSRTSFRPPKLFDAKTEAYFLLLKECGSQLGLPITWRESGGVCDGNTLGAKKVPTLDTLGVRGGMIHTEKEYMVIDSLCENTKLVVLFLSEVASKKIGFTL